MLSHEGSARTDRHNRRLAGTLALIAGFVNSAGYLLVGSFTSHVTGNVGRMANDVASGHGHAAAGAATMIAAFFAGAFVASMAIEANLFGRRSIAYGSLLVGEAALLIAFFAVSRLLLRSTDPRIHDAQALLLCAAMGLQNSLVTRLSGAVVRTTHLTGVVTDIGIESARWFRYLRHHVGTRSRIKMTFSSTPAERPHVPKLALLVTILGAFLVGAASGALVVARLHHLSLLIPAVGLAAMGIYALTAAGDLVAADAHR
jgi:uncharacterized membrane protein YoaK (UPF0700 family)